MFINTFTTNSMDSLVLVSASAGSEPVNTFTTDSMDGLVLDSASTR